jgi:hypothetical protein
MNLQHHAGFRRSRCQCFATFGFLGDSGGLTT